MIRYKRFQCLFFRFIPIIRGSVLHLTLPRAIFAAFLTFALKYWKVTIEDMGGGLMYHPYPLHAFILVVSFMTVFHTNMAYQRYWEARTQIQAFSSKLADVATQGIAFDEISDVQSVKGGVDFRAKFLHLMSLLHGVAIQYLLRGQVPLTIFGGISEEETVKLGKVQDQAYVVVHWLNKCIVKRCHEGGLAVAPPIQTRLFQELSNAMLAYNQACKIEDTPFPFPYVQLVHTFQLILAFMVPIVSASFIEDPYLAPVVAALAVGGFHAMVDCSLQMETPFGTRANDLPLAELHEDYNKRLACMIDIPTACRLTSKTHHAKHPPHAQAANGRDSQNAPLLDNNDSTPVKWLQRLSTREVGVPHFPHIGIGNGEANLLVSSSAETPHEVIWPTSDAETSDIERESPEQGGEGEGEGAEGEIEMPEDVLNGEAGASNDSMVKSLMAPTTELPAAHSRRLSKWAHELPPMNKRPATPKDRSPDASKKITPAQHHHEQHYEQQQQEQQPTSFGGLSRSHTISVADLAESTRESPRRVASQDL